MKKEVYAEITFYATSKRLCHAQHETNRSHMTKSKRPRPRKNTLNITGTKHYIGRTQAQIKNKVKKYRKHVCL